MRFGSVTRQRQIQPRTAARHSVPLHLGDKTRDLAELLPWAVLECIPRSAGFAAGGARASGSLPRLPALNQRGLPLPPFIGPSVVHARA